MRGEGSAALFFRAADHPSGLGSPNGAAEPILQLRERRIEMLRTSRGSLQDAYRGGEMDR